MPVPPPRHCLTHTVLPFASNFARKKKPIPPLPA